MSVSLQELKIRQAWPLEEKVAWALKQIRIWFDYWDGKVYVSYSGGKDSTVLLHLVRSMYPDVPAVFSNTGLEYPEIVEFVKATPNVVIVRPEMTYRRVLEEHGYPVVSKKTAKALRVLRENKPTTVNTRRLHMTGEKADGTFSKHFLLAEKWKFLLKAPFKISEKCCDVIKLKPIHEYEKKTGLVPYVETMAKDSRRRSASYLMTGCNSINSKKEPHSRSGPRRTYGTTFAGTRYPTARYTTWATIAQAAPSARSAPTLSRSQEGSCC